MSTIGSGLCRAIRRASPQRKAAKGRCGLCTRHDQVGGVGRDRKPVSNVVCCGFAATNVTEPIGSKWRPPAILPAVAAQNPIKRVQSDPTMPLAVVIKVIARNRPETAENRTFLGTRSQSGRRDLNPQHSAWKNGPLAIRKAQKTLDFMQCRRGQCDSQALALTPIFNRPAAAFREQGGRERGKPSTFSSIPNRLTGSQIRRF